jgi:xanthine dehydrogenase accessory factor
LSDFDKVLAAWQAATATDEDYVLASIVGVEGSSYRKPGARMILTRSGRRAGTISGGCLEAEVSKQAWWLTENGPVLKAYSTSFEMDDAIDGKIPYGLGCGGTVHLFLERRATADPFLRELNRSFIERTPLACSVVLKGPRAGERGFVGGGPSLLQELAVDALSAGQSTMASLQIQAALTRVFAEFIPARCGLFIFGAGDDAQPLVRQADTMGWQVTVADGRSHLATSARFPEADHVLVLHDSDLSALALRETDAAVVMTHSFEQDKKIILQLLQRQLLYRGALGPRYRTADLLKYVVDRIGGTATEWMQKLHAPVGLDLGGDGPASIALSIVADIQATLRHRPVVRQPLLRNA